ncbi:hypothetical protein SRABI44_02117 [Microbacterium foliorum]|nr:hypothetical protein SRABI03_00446 [Microbacterium foliorum]CAH0208835.1 hypothetical protein SRABI44_02117 [Microbacterium foliorum]
MVSNSELADSLDRLRTIALIESAAGALLLNEGTHGELLRSISGHDLSINAVHLPRSLVPGMYPFSWKQTIALRAPGNPVFDIMQPWAGVVALAAGDAMKRSDIVGTSLSEFTRHTRNAVAHDWHFDIRHMNGPAEFDGLQIERSMDGKPLMEYVAVGDLFALVDAVIAALRATRRA